ncbi:hypothetical protein D3C74_453910 [compost metagenome]
MGSKGLLPIAARAMKVIVMPTPSAITKFGSLKRRGSFGFFSFGKYRKQSRNRMTDTVSIIICVSARSGARKRTNSSVTM